MKLTARAARCAFSSSSALACASSLRTRSMFFLFRTCQLYKHRRVHRINSYTHHSGIITFSLAIYSSLLAVLQSLLPLRVSLSMDISLTSAKQNGNLSLFERNVCAQEILQRKRTRGRRHLFGDINIAVHPLPSSCKHFKNVWGNWKKGLFFILAPWRIRTREFGTFFWSVSSSLLVYMSQVRKGALFEVCHFLLRPLGPAEKAAVFPATRHRCCMVHRAIQVNRNSPHG